LADLGVRPVTLLFKGISDGRRYFGTAYLFHPQCGRVPYQVSGPILDNHRRVVLKGQAPRFGADCHVQGYFTDRLEFDLMGEGETGTTGFGFTGQGRQQLQDYEIAEGEGMPEAYLPMDNQKKLTLIMAGSRRTRSRKAVTLGLDVDEGASLSPGLSRLQNLTEDTSAMIDVCINAACKSHEWYLNHPLNTLATEIYFGRGIRSLEIVVPQDRNTYQFRGDVDAILRQICR
jgi:hypothetical protein